MIKTLLNRSVFLLLFALFIRIVYNEFNQNEVVKMKDFVHIPVMLKEAMTSLNVKPDGLYVDCTWAVPVTARKSLKVNNRTFVCFRSGPRGHQCLFGSLIGYQ